MTAFALDDGIAYHTYSAYARGLAGLWGMYQWLDRAPLGRNEQRGADDPLSFFRRHDEYDSQGILRTRERPHRRLPQGSGLTAGWRQQRCCSYSYRPARTHR